MTPRAFFKPGAGVALLLGLLLLAVLLLPPMALAQEAAPNHITAAQVGNPENAACLNCHAEQGLVLRMKSGEAVSVTTNGSELLASVHKEERCVDCHTDLSGYPHGELPVNSYRDLQIYYSQTCANCHDKEGMEQVDSVHAQLQASGIKEAAVCADCHGAHDTKPINRKDYPEVSLTASAEICQNCHSGIFDQFATSVHGEALIGEGNADVPTCTKCHPAHTAEDPRALSFRLSSPELCATCHADAALMKKYEISTEVFDTYVADFHGTTVMLFDRTNPNQITNKAVCTDCHGVHDIASATRDSEQIKANILPRCQECHPDATTNFASSWLGHYSPNFETAPLVTAITWFYRILIPILLVFFLLYIALDMYRHSVERSEKRKEANA